MDVTWQGLAIDLLRRCAKGLIAEPHASARSERLAVSHLDELTRLQIDSLYYICYDRNSPTQRLYDRVWDLQRKAARIILTELTGRGLAPVLFKGGEFLAAHYGDRSLAIMADVDLLVSRRDLESVKAVFYEAGYRKAKLNPTTGQLDDVDVAAIAEIEATHYELCPFSRLEVISLHQDELEVAHSIAMPPLFSRDGQCSVAIEFDVHHQVAADIESEPLFERAQPGSLGVGFTLSPADQLWLTIAKLYNEVANYGKRSLRDFAYVLPLLAKRTIEWNVVIRVAEEYELRPALFYYFSFLNQLSGNSIPEDVIRSLSPTNGSRLRDWGWQLGPIFDLVESYPEDLLRAQQPSDDFQWNPHAGISARP